jgi:hypothetical protein
MITKRMQVALTLALGLAAATVPAEPRAGIDRPIRVGLFKGTGVNRYWHTNIHTAHMELIQMLANPAGSNLGPDLPVPPKGFSFYATLLPQATAGGECAGSGCGPAPAEVNAFVAALDTLDVVLLNSMVDFGSRLTQTAHRDAFRNFWTRKGYIALHWTLDTYGTWAALDSIHGARFQNRSDDRTGTLRRDSVFEQEPTWQYLNRGLFSNGVDTSFVEEWMSLATSGATIRAVPHLKPTTKLDESSVGPLGGMTPMGDHPVSWYRHLPAGGRFFFTALGHRTQVWQSARTFRRQLYNAILWTAKYDSVSQLVSVHPPGGVGARFALRAEKGYLHFESDLPASVTVRTADGRLVARRSGSGETRFPLPSGALYLVTVDRGRGPVLSRRVAMP